MWLFLLSSRLHLAHKLFPFFFSCIYVSEDRATAPFFPLPPPETLSGKLLAGNSGGRIRGAHPPVIARIKLKRTAGFITPPGWEIVYYFSGVATCRFIPTRRWWFIGQNVHPPRRTNTRARPIYITEQTSPFYLRLLISVDCSGHGHWSSDW